MAKASANISGLDALSRVADGKQVLDFAEEALEESLEIGKEAMREAIETRGTGRTWERPRGGRAGSYPGRVDRGDMLDDVDGKLLSRTTTTVSGQLGWDDGSPFYYSLQEGGFTHSITGEEIEGMMALHDAAEVAKRHLIQELEQIGRNI
ncbi:hypothetical protein SEA_MUSETTA_49 [Microbacterium phage Musetta]|nr:hypothetical protein SEA_FORK_45 [Microbacterium phage Fork]AXH50205.1 hypothetical protein SEA_MUSETTA_49 [Microbacterium phage Musetta]QYC54168.1 hypothetical protein SEA_WELCOME_50 [Microbacterium phage Welcome]URM87452.1 hypothetical protein SEA_DUSTYDINO_52 [Microbacterium phage DustyDino]UVK62463.1 hypothetical protein SEA_YUMA_48 [Microbacterium phage Yuma]WMI33920.1 hypothetical protein SEA_ERENYEAGER_49 [Microbacterium phage Erenyeager]